MNMLVLSLMGHGHYFSYYLTPSPSLLPSSHWSWWLKVLIFFKAKWFLYKNYRDPFMSLKPVSPRKQRALQVNLDHITSLEDQFKLLLEHFKLKDKDEEEEHFHDAFDEPLPKKRGTLKKTQEKEHAEMEQYARVRALDWKLAWNREATRKAKEALKEQRTARALLSAQKERFSQVQAELDVLEHRIICRADFLAVGSSSVYQTKTNESIIVSFT